MQRAAGAAVRLTDVSRRWGGNVALDSVSLDVPPGTFTVLLGPSGCGKTTCLRIIAGLEAASSGTVGIGGRDVTDLPPSERGVAMVFQSYALFPHLTVAENILFGLKARRVPRAERDRRLARAIEILGIGGLLQRRPSQLSGGQQQRIALGRAVVAEAPVCLMDEPLSNLDAQLRAEMRREILALQRRLALTMLYVTHDQTEAMSMADRIVLLRDGRIEQEAAPEAMYAHPATSFVARFIGTPPMNIFPLQASADGLRIPGSDRVLAPVPPGLTQALEGGLRPERLRLAEAGLQAVVRHSEYLGADTILSCQTGVATLLVRLPGHVRMALGTSVYLHADEAPYLFDAATGRRLSLGEREARV